MNLKKKLGMAVLTTTLGASIVAAGSFAIFTSTAQNTGNTFTAGTLAISLDKADGTKYFDISNIAPGDSGSAKVTVKNDGSLELRYDIAESLTGDLAIGDYPLTVTIKDANGNTITPGTDNDRVLAKDASEELTVSWALPKDAGNGYQGKGATLGLTVNAEQTKNN